MRGRPKNEAMGLLEGLKTRKIRFFSLETAIHLSGKTANATALLLYRLAKDGQVTRLEHGLYALTPEDGETLHKLAVGRELAGGDGYTIGYGSALEVHGMAGAPKGVLPHKGAVREAALPDFVTVVLKGNRRLERRKVFGVEYLFVRDPEAARKIINPKPKPAQWMVMKMEVAPGEYVMVSDPEWTILSGLGRPELCGGVEVIAAVMEAWRERLDLEKLVRYTSYVRNRTAVRRLGYLLETLGMQTERTRLKLSLSVLTSYGRLEPGKPWIGEWDREWKLDVND